MTRAVDDSLFGFQSFTEFFLLLFSPFFLRFHPLQLTIPAMREQYISMTCQINVTFTSYNVAFKLLCLTYHCRSTRPPCRAITDFTRFAKSMALSPSFLYIGGRYHTSQTIAQLDIVMYKYCIIEYRLLFQNASPNLGSYCFEKNKHCIH